MASLQEFDAIYERLGVSFEVTYGESHYDEMLVPLVDGLLASGVAQESDGAVIIPFEGALEDRPFLVRKSDGAAADAILGELGASDGVDRDIILQLAAKRPLGHPERFDAAHAGAIRALEVLDRNGARRQHYPAPAGDIRDEPRHHSLHGSREHADAAHDEHVVRSPDDPDGGRGTAASAVG